MQGYQTKQNKSIVAKQNKSTGCSEGLDVCVCVCFLPINLMNLADTVCAVHGCESDINR